MITLLKNREKNDSVIILSLKRSLREQMDLFSNKIDTLFSSESKAAPETPRSIWQKHLKTEHHFHLTHWFILEAVKAIQTKAYSKFDAQTTTNCCHGMAMFVKQLIDEALTLDLAQIETDLEVLLIDPDKGTTIDHWIPDLLLELAALFMLNFVSELGSEGGRRTTTTKLKFIASVGTTYCNTIISMFRKYFSNKIAGSYAIYYDAIPKDQIVSGIPMNLWGKYIQPEYLRRDKRGLIYAPSLYSMKVLLGYLIHTKSKIALVNDINDQNGTLLDRYVQILEGNGKDGFTALSKQRMDSIKNSDEPMVVFAGCSIELEGKIERVHKETEDWLENFPSLILANYTFYPQFPGVGDDSDFDSNPIQPHEECVSEVINLHSQYQGVHASDFSTYYVTHLYSSSVQELFNESMLPNSSLFLPKEERTLFKKEVDPS